jgi:hypothetical protein
MREDDPVRGALLRWLLNDSQAVALFDKDGLQVVSAIIEADVDLDSSHVLYNLNFDVSGLAWTRAA